jgi:hypothetical protein
MSLASFHYAFRPHARDDPRTHRPAVVQDEQRVSKLEALHQDADIIRSAVRAGLLVALLDLMKRARRASRQCRNSCSNSCEPSAFEELTAGAVCELLPTPYRVLLERGAELTG